VAIQKGACCDLWWKRGVYILNAVLTMVLSTGSASAATPAAMFNKAIRVSYTVVGKVMTGAGPHEGTSQISRVIYVSSAGRLFERADWSKRGGRAVGEIDPSAATNRRGEARDMSFKNNRLVAHIAYLSGAGEMTVRFDPTFSSCEGEVRFGAEHGKAIARRDFQGTVYQFLSLRAENFTCSITPGNPFL
jgi:hypothetical protein